ncbi:MAG: nickel pincer cofactor biosynthesis protein LarC [Magnetococcales bacterium]|nr:nickel pincer cofactor biosynthesis protein LarC [Magnetococcales bacterium]
MKIHLDLEAGMAGNMFLAACLDLGLDRAVLAEALESVASGWSWAITRTQRGGVSGLHLEVTVPHEHHHRSLPTILALIQASGLPDPVKILAGTIFTNLAEAEARVHGIPVAEVHFHEVGALDAIIDICGAAFAVWRLGITHMTASPVPTGSGFVTCQHGRLPIPAPAVAELLRAHRVPLRPDAVEAELVTPTGAAILVTLVNRFGGSGLTRIDRIGHGLGSRVLPGRPNLVRILAQETDPPDVTSALVRESVVVLSSHLDDMNPEWYGPLWEHLLGAGALDVALIPMTMKKGRPGVRLEVMARPGQETVLAEMVLAHTTALGVRLAVMDRLILPRTAQTVATPWGVVRAKEAGGVWRLEHDDLEQLAKRQGWTLLQAQQTIAPFLTAAIGAAGALPLDDSSRLPLKND